MEVGQTPVGCENSSRRYRVLVDNTAEPITAQNTSITGCPRRCNRAPRLRWRQRQGSMRPVAVVVIDEHLKDSLEVRLIENQ
jgi:hypothetical protein